MTKITDEDGDFDVVSLMILAKIKLTKWCHGKIENIWLILTFYQYNDLERLKQQSLTEPLS